MFIGRNFDDSLLRKLLLTNFLKMSRLFLLLLIFGILTFDPINADGDCVKIRGECHPIANLKCCDEPGHAPLCCTNVFSKGTCQPDYSTTMKLFGTCPIGTG